MKLVIKGKELVLELNEQQLKELQEMQGKEIEIIKGANDLIILRSHEKKENKKEIEENNSRIFELLNQKSLSERVEGKFEKLLNKEENQKLQELLKTGEIILFKLNTKYRKGVYKTKKQMQKKPEIETKKDLKNQQNREDYSLTKNGFMILKNDTEAREASNNLKEKIESAEIKGIKGFDGAYYIIETNTYQKLRNTLLECFKTKTILTSEEITQRINVNKDLAITVCEFLKDEGEIFEKRKEQYHLT